MFKNFDTTLYFITDSTGFSEEEFLSRVEQALKGGVTLLQLREKEKTTREYISIAEKVHKITYRYNIPLIIDDRVDVALAVNAEGVHVGQSDMPVHIARKLMGADKIIGATTKTIGQATEAYAQGADYLGVGAIYPTTTKVKTVLTSVETLCQIVKAVPIKVNAIGGLNKDNMDVLKNTGVAGMCVVSAIMKADNPKTEAEKIKRYFIEKISEKIDVFHNLITKSGKIVFDEPVDFIVYYGDDYALVKFDGKYN